MSDQQQQIDPALEAAAIAYFNHDAASGYDPPWEDTYWDDVREDYRSGASKIIRAYEAHKASAVPEEIAEVVAWLREWAQGANGPPTMHKAWRAADLLEGYARQAAPAGSDKPA